MATPPIIGGEPGGLMPPDLTFSLKRGQIIKTSRGRYLTMLSKIFLLSFFIFCIAAMPAGVSHADPLQNWATITSHTNDWFYGMAYGTVSGNNMFVTVGDSGTLLTSPDGVAWTLGSSGDTHHLFGVGYGNGTFVAVGTVGTILTSTDGATWTPRVSGTADYLYGAAYGNSRFVVVGASGTVLTSADNGVTWNDPFWPSASPTDNWLYGITYGWEFAAVGDYDGTPAYSELLTSPDAVPWTSQNAGTTAHLFGIGYGSGTFAAVGEQGVILTSTDGTAWNTVRAGAPGNETLNGVSFGTANSIDYFVAVGDAGAILTSPASDLLTWTYRPSGTAYDLQAVAYDFTNQAFAAVGGYGTILLDGDTIPTSPVRFWQPHDIYFESLQTAYDNLDTGTLIESQAVHLNENLFFDRNISVTLKGGYDAMYTNNPSATTINGTLTISDGSLIVEHLVIR
jgi:photosystem II stability/assembly factor-like uncharacterized protein